MALVWVIPIVGIGAIFVLLLPSYAFAPLLLWAIRIRSRVLTWVVSFAQQITANAALGLYSICAFFVTYRASSELSIYAAGLGSFVASTGAQCFMSMRSPEESLGSHRAAIWAVLSGATMLVVSIFSPEFKTIAIAGLCVHAAAALLDSINTATLANSQIQPKSLLDALQETEEFQQSEELFKALELLCENGVDADTMPNGHGTFGHSSTNPIPTRTIFGTTSYLSRLREPDGSKISYERIGSVEANVSNYPIDVYAISNLSGVPLAKLYFSPYQKRVSSIAPKGFLMADTMFSHVQQVEDDDAEIAVPRDEKIIEQPSVGRMEPCPCGSGKRFKHCHGAFA